LAVDPAFSTSVSLGEEHEMLRDMPYLLCVANSYPHKNIPLLVEGFAQMQTPMRLVLVGKPRRGEAAVQSALARLDAQTRGRVVRVDHVTHEALIALYQNCAVFVFPSLYEGFGLPVLEAMLAGVPVVAADIPTMREIGGAAIRLCRAHDAGDMAESIRRALDESPAETRNRRDAARHHAQTYTWERTARLTRACFERALAEDPIAL
jgi:glycosyltransferase involved in cell wall biosynthesis